MSDWQIISPPYTKVPLQGNSWFFKMTQGWKNNTYTVLARQVCSKKIKHIAICRNDGAVVTWAEKQKIKSELFGEERQAVEFYPKESELIDDGNVYHLWLLPPDCEVKLISAVK